MVKVQLLRKIYELYKIPIQIYQEGLELNILRIPEEVPIFNKIDVSALSNVKSAIEKNQAAIFFMEDENFFWGAMQDCQKNIIIFGPMSQKPVDKGMVLEYKYKHKLESELLLCHISMKSVRKILSFLELEINNKDIAEQRICIETTIESIKEWNLPADLVHYELEQSELEHDHNSIEYEEMIMRIVRTGDLEAVEKVIYGGDGLCNQHIGVVARSDEKQSEYLCVAMFTIICRAAVEGGMNQEKAYSLSDIYMRRLEKCKDSTEMYALAARAQYEFTYEVWKAKKVESEIYYIEQCKKYIAKNLRKPLKVGDIAPVIGINRSYLARRFAEIERITIQNYITKERCIQAANMLQYSNYSIALIAEYFCFSSQSHFGKCFSRFYGMTPKTYRNKHQRKIDF